VEGHIHCALVDRGGTDEELEEFLAFVNESRHTDLA
jgi:hypothetical protein